MKVKIFLFIISATFLIGCQSTKKQPMKVSPEIDILHQLDTKGFTGGLSLGNRRLSEKIQSALSVDFKKVSCETPEPLAGILVSQKASKDIPQLSSLKGLNPIFIALVSALSHQRQEVRDTAAYSLALIGPSAIRALPFLSHNQSNKLLKGQWYNFAISKITCESWAGPDFRRVLVDGILPSERPWIPFLKKSATILANLYLDENIEYPEGMLGYNFGNFSFSNTGISAAPSLAKIADNESLSLQKRREALEALNHLEGDAASIAIPILKKLSTNPDDELKWQSQDLLIKLGQPQGVDFLITRIQEGDFVWSWEDELCTYGNDGVRAESELQKIVQNENWPKMLVGAVNALGCIGSKKAIPKLTKLLNSNNWLLAEAAAKALGKIGVIENTIISALNKTYQTSWSKIVRESARNALVNLGELESSNRSHEEDNDENMIFMKMGPSPIDHGLPWCDETGKYSTDNERWFSINWESSERPEPPRNFPSKYIADHGTRTFLKVDNGWLYGSELGHYDGEFLFWSENGEEYSLSDAYTDIYKIMHHNNKIIAFGYQVIAGGDSGALFEIEKVDGIWKAKQFLTLPSPPFGYAISPDGHLLLSDGPNDYAIIDREIVPLKCEKTFDGNYFN